MTDPLEKPVSGEGPDRALSSLLDALKAHNDEHGQGARMGKMMGGMLRAAVDGEDVDMGEAAQKAAAEDRQDTHAGLTALRARFEATLSTLGLGLVLEPARDEESEASGTVLLLIVDPDKLIEMLARFPKGEEPLVERLAGELERQVRAIDFDAKSDDDNLVLENLPQLATALRDAAPNAELGLVERYAAFAKKGTLDNYLQVEFQGLWQEPGKGFGPADWVGDATPEVLERNWQGAIAALAAQDAARGEGVGAELREHLLKCISHAAGRVQFLSWPEEKKKALNDVLVKYTKQLIAGPVN